MADSFYQILGISAQQLSSQMLDLDVVSHNIANMNTPGFQASRANFQELLANQGLSGVSLGSTQILQKQGAINPTGNPLDVAIQGEGFFAVQLPDGRTAYTRNGALQFSGGQLTTAGGVPLTWDGQLPPGTQAVRIDAGGKISAQVNGQWSPAGALSLYRFPNPTALQAYGGSLYLPTDDSGTPNAGQPGQGGFGRLVPSALENANVDLADQMTQLTLLQRALQLSARALQQTDTMMGQAISLRQG